MSRVPESVRYFECVRESTNTSKFWAIRFEKSIKRPGGIALRVWWGRIGTAGQTDFVDDHREDDETLKEAYKRANEKMIEGGYVERTECPSTSPFLPTGPYGWVDGDGWTYDAQGRAVRPDQKSEPISRAPRPLRDRDGMNTLAAIASREARNPESPPSVIRARAERVVRVTTTVTLSNERTIDFEE